MLLPSGPDMVHRFLLRGSPAAGRRVLSIYRPNDYTARRPNNQRGPANGLCNLVLFLTSFQAGRIYTHQIAAVMPVFTDTALALTGPLPAVLSSVCVLTDLPIAKDRVPRQSFGHRHYRSTP